MHTRSTRSSRTRTPVADTARTSCLEDTDHALRLAPIRAAAVIAVTLVAIVAARSPQSAAAAPPPTYDVYAVRYATMPRFRVSGLIAGADTSRRIDIAMMVWLIKGPDGRNVLVDAGFHRADLVSTLEPDGVRLRRGRRSRARRQAGRHHGRHHLARALGSSGRDRSVPEGARLDSARGVHAPPRLVGHGEGSRDRCGRREDARDDRARGARDARRRRRARRSFPASPCTRAASTPSRRSSRP